MKQDTLTFGEIKSLQLPKFRQILLRYLVVLVYPIIDFIASVLAILSSYKIYRLLGLGKKVYYTKPDIIIISLIASFFTVLILIAFGAYKKESGVLNVEEIKNVIKGLTFTFMLSTVILVFVKFSPARYVLSLSYIISLIFIIAERTMLYHILPSTALLRTFNKKILIYGAGELGQALYKSIVNSPKLGIIPVGFIDDQQAKVGKSYYPNGINCTKGISVLGTCNNISQLKKEFHIDEVYIAMSNIKYSTLINIIDKLKSQNIKVSFVPNLYKVFVHKIKIETIGEIPLIKEIDIGSYYHLYVKKYLDILLAIFLLFLLWPLFLVIALAIKMDSKGPVLFKQERVGKNGKIFKIYKFRSMYLDTDAYAVNPLDRNDHRITQMGKFLRKASLDELPQLFNIVKQEMSFVGPRPEMRFIVEQYNDIHKERLKATPGITGLWQLSGDRKKAIHENMDYDLYYVKKTSFFLDLAILIETLIYAFNGI